MVRARHVLAAVTSSLLCTASLVAQAADYETTRIADGVYQFRWQGHNGFFVVTPSGVLAADPISPEAAAQYAREIKKVAPDAPLLAIVYSHEDADHATGAPALMEGMGVPWVPIIAQRNAAPNIARAGSTDLPVPTVTYQRFLGMSLGGRQVELHYLGANHSDNSTVIYVPDARVAFAVDFVSHDRVGFRDLPGWHFDAFYRSMPRLLELGFETMVFGHGPAGDRSSIHRQIRYYDDIKAAVASALAEGWSEDRAAAEIRLLEYADWGRYEAWFPLNVRAIYRWMAGG